VGEAVKTFPEMVVVPLVQVGIFSHKAQGGRHTPVASQVCPAGQLPHLSTPPHPSPIVPQYDPVSVLQVTGWQTPLSGEAPHR
jgi:hypothetical protein